MIEHRWQPDPDWADHLTPEERSAVIAEHTGACPLCLDDPGVSFCGRCGRETFGLVNQRPAPVTPYPDIPSVREAIGRVVRRLRGYFPHS